MKRLSRDKVKKFKRFVASCGISDNAWLATGGYHQKLDHEKTWMSQVISPQTPSVRGVKR